MYFILSKVLLFIILPLNWILALLLTSIFARRQKLKLRSAIAAILLLAGFTSPLLINAFARVWNYPPDKVQGATYSCAIVLGGFSDIDNNGRLFFNGASDRFIQGVKLVETGKAARILISGGNGSLFDRRYSEAPLVGAELKSFKIPGGQILIEGKSRNTLENALFSKRLLDSSHIAGPYILVTSAFHMRRSMFLFKKAGLNVVAYPCNYFAGGSGFSWSDLMPNADDLGYWNIYLKEVVGFIVAHFQKVHA